MSEFFLPEASGYVVALSGGADSRLLLQLAIRAVSACSDHPPFLHAAHLHHGIRGEEADRDEAFCRAACAEWGVALTVERADIPALARASGRSLETEARLARYEFLVRVMQATDCPLLLTAHNADDQLETLLFRLLRGSGTGGMAGIPESRPLGATLADGTPLRVFRPLLHWSRREILETLSEMGVSYVTDSTNLQDHHTRNYLRHHVTPLLEEIAGQDVPQAAAVRLGRAASEDAEALALLAAERYHARVCDRGLPLSALTETHPAIAKRMILLAYKEATLAGDDPARTLSSYHLEDILALCHAPDGRRVSDHLPCDFRAEIQDGCLLFRPYTGDAVAHPRPQDPLLPLSAGVTVWDEGTPRITVEIDLSDDPLPPSSGADVFASACFPPSVMPLWARRRAAGDVILSHGLHKKLKKLLCDKHIPLSLRDRLPLFCAEDGTPLWYPGAAVRDGLPPPANGPTLRVTIRVGSLP